MFRDLSAMTDLNTLFILTDSGSVLSFSPVTNSFTENTLSLPDNSQPIAITFFTTSYL